MQKQKCCTLTPTKNKPCTLCDVFSGNPEAGVEVVDSLHWTVVGQSLPLVLPHLLSLVSCFWGSHGWELGQERPRNKRWLHPPLEVHEMDFPWKIAKKRTHKLWKSTLSCTNARFTLPCKNARHFIASLSTHRDRSMHHRMVGREVPPARGVLRHRRLQQGYWRWLRLLSRGQAWTAFSPQPKDLAQRRAHCRKKADMFSVLFFFFGGAHNVWEMLLFPYHRTIETMVWLNTYSVLFWVQFSDISITKLQLKCWNSM